METPIKSFTNEEKNENYEISEQFELQEKYRLLIGLSNDNCLILELIENNNLNFNKNKTKLSLDDLIKKSKIFKMCDNIKEFIEFIKKLYQEKII